MVDSIFKSCSSNLPRWMDLANLCELFKPMNINMDRNENNPLLTKEGVIDFGMICKRD